MPLLSYPGLLHPTILGAIMHALDTIQINDDYRIRVYQDEDAENPRTAWGSEPGHMFIAYGDRGRYIHPDGSETDYEYAYDMLKDAARHRRWDAEALFERWLRIHFGRAIVETYSTRDYTLLIYVTREDIDLLGWQDASDDEIRESLRAACETYRQWAEGEVYGVVLEARVKWSRVDGTDMLLETWEEVDNIWGNYLTHDYTALDVAREHFTEMPKTGEDE